MGASSSVVKRIQRKVTADKVTNEADVLPDILKPNSLTDEILNSKPASSLDLIHVIPEGTVKSVPKTTERLEDEQETENIASEKESETRKAVPPNVSSGRRSFPRKSNLAAIISEVNDTSMVQTDVIPNLDDPLMLQKNVTSETNDALILRTNTIPEVDDALIVQTNLFPEVDDALMVQTNVISEMNDISMIQTNTNLGIDHNSTSCKPNISESSSELIESAKKRYEDWFGPVRNMNFVYMSEGKVHEVPYWDLNKLLDPFGALKNKSNLPNKKKISQKRPGGKRIAGRRLSLSKKSTSNNNCIPRRPQSAVKKCTITELSFEFDQFLRDRMLENSPPGNSAETSPIVLPHIPQFSFDDYNRYNRNE